MQHTKKAFYAGGCFWGVEHLFKDVEGVVNTTVGYMGGTVDNPSYEQVSGGTTGHAEAIEIKYNPAKTNFEKLTRFFFEIHDSTQVDRQGPDIGAQYRSEIFFVDEKQRKIAGQIIEELKKKNLAVATKLSKAEKFWPAEEYHQEYYKKTGGTPYCHVQKKIF